MSYSLPANEDGEEHKLDVMAMVHLADPLYYQELQQRTEHHERVLYELIVDKDVVMEDQTGARRLKQPMVLPPPPPPVSFSLSLSFIHTPSRSLAFPP